MHKAPYDERNRADYVKVTESIEFALGLMRDNLNIAVTQASLSKLAGCSRNTLRNRKYPIERLKEIKKLRSQKVTEKPARITRAHFLSVDEHVKKNKALETQINRSRTEIAVWVNKYFSLEAENKKLRRANEVLKRSKELLEAQLEDAKNRPIEQDDSNFH